jgi:hypothetical protein
MEAKIVVEFSAEHVSREHRTARALPRPRPLDPEVRAVTAPRYGYNFSRVRVHPESAVPPIVSEALASSGVPLDPSLSSQFGGHFGHDFSRVRVFANGAASAATKRFDARAFTLADRIVIDPAFYPPRTPDSMGTVAHELAHVVQASGARPGPAFAIRMGGQADEAEREADAAAGAFRSATPSRHAPQNAGPPVLHRYDTSVLRRQPAAAPSGSAAPSTPSLYSQGLTLLQSKAPDVYRGLSKASPDGGPAVIRDLTVSTVDTPPVTLKFHIELKISTGKLSGRNAEFKRGTPQLNRGTPQLPGSTGSYTETVEIVVDPTGATAADMARALFHEGTHMLIYLEGILPTSPAGPHAAGLAAYAKTANASRNGKQLLIVLEVQIDLDLRSRQEDPASAPRWAKAIFDKVIEEKFVFDQEHTTFGSAPGNAPVASGYLTEGFKLVGVRQPSPADFNRMVTLAAATLDEIDQANKPPPPKSPPAGSGSSAVPPAPAPQPTQP